MIFLLGKFVLGIGLLPGLGRARSGAGVAAEMRWNIPAAKSILPFFVR